ncbi:50S ribosomal protein L25 [Lachnoclostridium phytofermentans]|uniref:Large ribosomal subunit protein bL25 n=1 Tax=Lachnoclostridium phytofermentans (strain ATCC 700394 / DSM 18823 / ISDg) TaxID=357809 RepID=RL25_LACP7|nr:50S ribosomal protein L25 [Lachnoclostridium phytofermentans]A9KSE6.1 RecName: Full=Large ribosomal subunit protein bL25; AltName: Full=50S ribosomal protein L25; AltName: Full=General stress protein CTC [Lachnoclostridium phytofermentans ISDg]ABX42178.1 ribosomal 5S rRNA E-loop binding protein Ctc/L25/TL5 [Lachnoclostridium phytofermentans ISDg]
MQETALLNMVPRTSTSKGANKLLRNNGYLPGNIFGKGMESISIAVKKDEFKKSIKEYGRNAVFKLVDTNNKEYTVMTKEITVAPLINEISHLNFQLVSLSEAIKQEVAFKIIGTEFLESKRLLLNSHVDSVPVSGLPHDIPHELEIDVSSMNSGDSLLFKDIKLPEGITSDVDPELKIITVKGLKRQEVAASE